MPALMFTFCAASDLAIVGFNPEMADVVNPHGHVYGEVWKVVATDDLGMRCSLSAEDREDAERMAEALTVRHDSLGQLPVNFSAWQPERPEYGSPAYVAHQFEECALERMEDEHFYD